MQLQKFLNILLDINEFAVTNNAFLVVYDEPISRTISVSAVNLSGPFFLCKWSFSLYDWNQLPNNIRMAFGSARVRVYFFSRLTKKRFSIDGLLHLFENEVMLEAINEEWIQICRRIISKQLDEKAKLLLVQFLTTKQRDDLEKCGWFVVDTMHHRYKLGKRCAIIGSNDKETHKFCINAKNWVPHHDNMLAIKL
ncbi:MAG TPA: hypothetical protein VI423_10680, partial [Paenisporosarcina sp.]|nr:hypothetical protein [Paenisporosarcina sp.]